ncbi:MAG: hypothetical protein QM722_23665 [Piscinibacter sp.]
MPVVRTCSAAANAASRTASTSLPSAACVGRPWPFTQSRTSALGMVSSRRTKACHWLFSHTYSSGSFQVTARLTDSCRMPSQAAPSPKNTVVMPPGSVPAPPIFWASATPGASDSSPPTMVEVNTTPSSLAETCSEPLLPRQ